MTCGLMSAARLEALLARFPAARVAVVGDFFLDRYLDVDPSLAETSVESGRAAHQVVAVRHSPGVAGTVVANLAALGARALHAVGFTGDDGESYDLRRDLQAMGCSTEHLHLDAGRVTPTYLKPRSVDDPTLAGEHERYDTKNRDRTPRALEERVLASLDALLGELDAVIIADQVETDDCGVITAAVRRALAALARRRPEVIFWADSRTHIQHFRGVVIKPNQFEAVGWAAPGPDQEVPLDELLAAVVRLRREGGAPVVATCGARGMIVSDPALTIVPGVRVTGETDITGAGDAASAGAVLALAAGAELREAALVGNLVASITIEQLATTGTARPEDLPPRLDIWRRQQEEAR